MKEQLIRHLFLSNSLQTVESSTTILIFGMFYPVYSTFKALRMEADEDYLKWLKYWLIFALLIFAETPTATGSDLSDPAVSSKTANRRRSLKMSVEL
jgi:hypothetical protein